MSWYKNGREWREQGEAGEEEESAEDLPGAAYI